MMQRACGAATLALLVLLAGCAEETASPSPAATKRTTSTTTTSQTSAATTASSAVTGLASATDVRTSTPTTNSVTILWKAGKGTTESWVEYGTTTTYGIVSAQQLGTGDRSVFLTGLQAGKTYHYRVVASDDASRLTLSADYTFTTTAGTTTSSPAPSPSPTPSTTGSAATLEISDVQASGVTESGFTITWTVSGPSTGTSSRVQYGATTAYGSQSSSQTGTGSRSATITGLASGTTYHFRVTATSDGQTADSADLTVQTSASALAISDVTVSEVTATSFRVDWTASGPSTGTTSKVQYGTSAAYGSESASMSGTGTKFATITGLSEATTYHFRVTAASGGQSANSSDQTTQTASTPLAISGVSVSDVTTTSFKVSWTIAGPSTGTTSKAQYGTTTAYGSESQPQTGTGAKTVTIAGLNEGTSYHFRVTAASGQATSNSPDQSQRTATSVTFTIVANNGANSYAQSPVGALNSPLRVTVTNTHAQPHTWTVASPAYNSGGVTSGASYTFPNALAFAAGTYAYYCAFHQSMTGSLTIN